MITKTYKAPTMHCTACVMMLEGLEEEVPGVERVEASLKHLEVTITFDELVVQEKSIIEAAHKEGYELIAKVIN